MSDSVLDKALKRRQILAEELAEVERFIALYQGFQDARDGQLKRGRDMQPGFAGGDRETPKRKGYPALLADEVFRILVETGSPLSRRALVRELQKRGFSLPPTDPSKYIGTILWRHKARFNHVEGEGYWIHGREQTKRDSR